MSKKDPPKDKGADDKPAEGKPMTPEEIFASAPLEAMIAGLAKAFGNQQGLTGPELQKYMSQVTGQVQHLVRSVQLQEHDHQQRKAAAAEVEKLIDQVAKTGSVVGKAVAAQRDTIAAQFRGVDLDKLAKGLRVFADWLQNPTDEGQAKVQELIDSLQQTMGPLIGYDPQREEQKRQEQIRATVKASLDEIFRPGKKT